MSDPFEHIDAYIQNQLSEAENKAFEVAMLQDETLRSAVENYHLVKGIGMGFLEVEVRDILNKENNKIKPVSKPNYKWWIPVFIIFLAILSYFFLKYYKTKQREERIAYVMNDYVPPQVVFTRSGEIEGDTVLFDRAKREFSLRNYSHSNEILESMPESDRTDEWHWIMGHVKFILKDFEKAKSNFELVSNNFEGKDDILKMKKRICQIQPSTCRSE